MWEPYTENHEILLTEIKSILDTRGILYFYIERLHFSLSTSSSLVTQDDSIQNSSRFCCVSEKIPILIYNFRRDPKEDELHSSGMRLTIS